MPDDTRADTDQTNPLAIEHLGPLDRPLPSRRGRFRQAPAPSPAPSQHEPPITEWDGEDRLI